MRGVDLHLLRAWTTFYPHAVGFARAHCFVCSGSGHDFWCLKKPFYHCHNICNQFTAGTIIFIYWGKVHEKGLFQGHNKRITPLLSYILLVCGVELVSLHGCIILCLLWSVMYFTRFLARPICREAIDVWLNPLIA